ncbi:MAG: hydrolase [Deltaproteobacteria bacterium]|nr:hydrolase [Deltaproteobacteria bacterium]
MPFTLFHFGPGATISLLLNRHINVPAFLLANVVVDFEPFMVMMFSLSYPLHGYAHSFLGVTALCSIFGYALYFFRGFITEFMQRFFRRSYSAKRDRMVISSLLGGWFHVLLDSMIYYDIRPFYPININPFLGMVDSDLMYRFCAISFIPASIFYFGILVIDRYRKRKVS